MRTTGEPESVAEIPDSEIFLDLIAGSDEASTGTSDRIPDRLREAAVLAAGLGFADSLTSLAVRGLRDRLEAMAWRLALDRHYRERPEDRPTLAMVAKAGAEMDRSDLAGRPDLIDQAAEWCEANRPDATPRASSWSPTGCCLPAGSDRSTVVLDAEAVSALSNRLDPKHRKVLAWAELGAQRNRRRPGSVTLVVPTSVRLESGWDRQNPRASIINRLPVLDHPLDPLSADRAARIDVALHVGVANAHLGAIIETFPAPLTVLTSDADDIERINSHLGARANIVRI